MSKIARWYANKVLDNYTNGNGDIEEQIGWVKHIRYGIFLVGGLLAFVGAATTTLYYHGHIPNPILWVYITLLGVCAATVLVWSIRVYSYDRAPLQARVRFWQAIANDDTDQ